MTCIQAIQTAASHTYDFKSTIRFELLRLLFCLSHRIHEKNHTSHSCVHFDWSDEYSYIETNCKAKSRKTKQNQTENV